MIGPRRYAADLAHGLLVRAPSVGILGWAFAEGEVTSPVHAGAAVLGVVLVSLAVMPSARWRWRPLALARFLPFFLAQSLQGGADVAVRALHPRLPVRPGTIDYPLRLPAGPARVFFVVVLSLLPGTLSAQLRGDVLRVHLLHRDAPARERAEALELRVADLFGVEI